MDKSGVCVCSCACIGWRLCEAVAGGCQEQSTSCGVGTHPSDAEGNSRTEDAATCQSSGTSTGGKCDLSCLFDFD